MLDSRGHQLLHALQWEQYDYEVSNKQERWGLDETESKAVKKWIDSRIHELRTIRDGNR